MIRPWMTIPASVVIAAVGGFVAAKGPGVPVAAGAIMTYIAGVAIGFGAGAEHGQRVAWSQ